jgi:hypothetical protein
MRHGLLPAHGLQRKKGLHGIGLLRCDTQGRHCTGRHQRSKAHALSDSHRAEGGQNRRSCYPRNARWPWQHRNLLNINNTRRRFSRKSLTWSALPILLVTTPSGSSRLL